ncbi:MAG: copper homeostasis protein CutC [Ginsengibacter sp.]
MKLEIIGFNIESCIAAQRAGAHRIELCDNPIEGGTTPSCGFIKEARKALQIDLYVMIRPRGGDFLYNEAEYEMMKADIEMCKKLGCDGVVLGILTPEGKVDKEKCKTLTGHAYPLGVTFHRAFDRTANAMEAMEDIIEIGCERILTSGLQPKAFEGQELIKQLIIQADERIIIMPGSGVTSGNIVSLAESTGAKEFHGSAGFYKASEMKYANSAMNEQLQHIAVNEEEVFKMRKLLESDCK